MSSTLSTDVPNDHGTTAPRASEGNTSHISQRIDQVLDISSFVLTTLQDVASFSPVPFLQQSAGLALGIINYVQQVRGNKELFERLAQDTCNLIYSVAIIYAEREQEGGQLSEDLNNDIGGLVSILTSISEFARKKASRNLFVRIVLAGGDADKVHEYRERLRQSLDVFWLQSTIRVRDNLTQIAKQQGAMYQVLEDQRSGGGAGTRPASEAVPTPQHGRLEVLSATQYNRDIFQHIRGEAGTQNIAGNQINNLGSNNTTQTTTKIVEAITGGSGGHGGSGTYGGAGGQGGNVSLSM